MSVLDADALARLERLTDPADVALREAREVLDDLESAINFLSEAVDEDGDDARNYLSGLAHDAVEVLTRLAGLLEEKNR